MKYRHLRLKSSGGLSKLLHCVDSLCQVDSKMRDSVITKEKQNQRDFEIMQKVFRMENEARGLKKKVRKKGG